MYHSVILALHSERIHSAESIQVCCFFKTNKSKKSQQKHDKWKKGETGETFSKHSQKAQVKGFDLSEKLYVEFEQC